MESVITYYPIGSLSIQQVDRRYNIIININDTILQFITECVNVTVNIGRLIMEYINVSSYQKILNRRHGLYEKYYHNKWSHGSSILFEKCNYNFGRKHGLYHKYNRQGNITCSILFDNGKIKKEYDHNAQGQLVAYFDHSQILDRDQQPQYWWQFNKTNYIYSEYISYSSTNGFIIVTDMNNKVIKWSILHMLFESHLCYDLINIILTYY
jgi:hypothetical protein